MPFWLRDFASNLVANWAAELFTPSSMIGLAIAAVIAIAWAVGWHRRQRAKGERGMQPIYLIVFGLGGAALCLVIAVGGYIWQQWDIHTAVITWNFEDTKNPYFILGMSKSGTNESLIISFQAQGMNNSDDPIKNVNGYIRSDVTNAQYAIWFVIEGQPVAPDDTYGIPPHAQFQITSNPTFSSSDAKQNSGIPASKFLIEFAKFTFVFNYDGMIYSRHFISDEIKRQIQHFEDQITPSNSTTPRVTKKPKAAS